jgi:hypothetical protein
MQKRSFIYQKLFIITSLQAFLCFSLWAKSFTNQYCEFELPTGWDCNLEGGEWVCQSSDAERQKEAIIILAAKVRGEQDTLADYQAYLKQIKTFNLPGSKSQVSEPKYTEQKQINGHTWVDSLHLASEVPGFYTRYLATVKEDLGIAITFSVAKDFYSVYQGVFDKTVATLKVFRQKQESLANFKLKRQEDKTFDQATFVPENQKFDISNKKDSGAKKDGSDDDLLLYLLLGGAAAAGFVIMRKKKGAKAPKKVKKKKS